MSSTGYAHLTGFIGALMAFAGSTGLTSADIAGFMNVVGAIVALVSIIVAHFTHKTAIANAVG
jgi:hypothetical protein